MEQNREPEENADPQMNVGEGEADVGASQLGDRGESPENGIGVREAERGPEKMRILGHRNGHLAGMKKQRMSAKGK